ncbi:MAG: UPF0182 family protein [Bacteroidales bacterium]
MRLSDDDNDRSVIDVRGGRRRRPLRLILAVILVALVLGAGAMVSWYVEALWFGSLGFSSVFWTTFGIKVGLFAAFFAATVLLLKLAFLALRPRRSDRATFDRTVILNGRPVRVSFKPVARIVSWAVAVVVAAGSALTMAAEWTTFVLYWHRGTPGPVADPVFNRPLDFYLMTLPALQMIASWLTTLAIIALGVALLYFLLSVGERAISSVRGLAALGDRYGGLSLALGALLLVLAWRMYLGRFDRLFHGGVVFSGAGYTDVHIIIPGLLIVAVALVVGALVAFVNAVRPRKLLWLAVAVAPAIAAYLVVNVVSWYVAGFIVKPNELDRETPYIRHNIALTQQGFGLAHIELRAYPAETGVDALDLASNRVTLDNVRLWDWRALQDTLRQIQAIRTYYDFPDIDIDRYMVGGVKRQMMVAAREISTQRLPENSRNWINQKLIYTHGYGVTMNPVNGFTPEGLPTLVLSDMPVRSTSPDVKVTRPEIYFGQLTDSDVYVRTRQREFNYPQGESNNFSSYEGRSGIPIGSMWRRLLIALDQGDLSKLPFSDDITPDSMLLMRRDIRERVGALAPFLTFDPDAYVVVGRNGRLYWLLDAFTSASTFPYSTQYRVGDSSVNYLRNSVKVVVDAYEGSVDFYVFDPTDPIIQAYRRAFPAMFRDASQMPADLRDHVRYPELLLKVQAAVYSLYHMTDPQAFYNREDLWSIASQVTLSDTTREQVSQPLEPNFVLMKLPGGSDVEFIEILPFTPAKRNNLIGWIAARSDGAAYGRLLVYNFPKTQMVDGPLQIEARIDQNPQLSGQLSLWNQQGSHVRRGNLLVMPLGRALFYAEPIYLQAERSPMPELRLVVLALQDRLAYGTSFDAALKNLLSDAALATRQADMAAAAGLAQQVTGGAALQPPAAPPAAQQATGAEGREALIDQAVRDLADYQRLTAEGKLGEAGQRLESLKRTLELLKPPAAPPPSVKK